jgi:hypothetical protein
MQCDINGNKTNAPKFISINTDNTCNPLLVLSHVSGCPVFSATSWAVFLNNNPWVIAILMIVFGAIVTFFGRKFFQYTVAVVGAFLTFLIVMLLCSIFGWLNYLEGDHTGGNLALTILSFFLAIGLAVGAGFILNKLIRVGAIILAGAAGFFLGITVYQFAFHWVNNLYVMIGLSVGFALILAVLSFKYFDKVLIFGTALIGSYSFVRGISLFAGHFPNEILVMQQLGQGIKPTFDNIFYAYMAGIVVLFVLGAVFQTKTKAKEEDDADYHKIH